MNAPQRELAQRLADETLQHMDRERDLLRLTIEKTTAVRERLLNRQIDEISNKVSELDELRKQSTHMSLYRQHLCQAIGVALRIPPQTATLRALANRVDPQRRQQLMLSREGMLRMTAELKRLQRANLMIASLFSNFSTHLLESITGQPSQPCYGPTGRIETATTSYSFQADL